MTKGTIDRSKPESWPYILHPIQIQQIADMGKNKTLELLNSGELPAKRVRGRWLINRDSFLKWLNSDCHDPADEQQNSRR